MIKVTQGQLFDEAAAEQTAEQTEEQKALAIIAESGGMQTYDEEAFAGVTSAGYLSRLQLMTSSSDAVKKGEFPANHYALVSGKNLIDLGPTVDVLVVAWRPKALDTTDVISVFDFKSEQFKKIAERSEVADSGCMFGPEFLVFVPGYNDGVFATFFMGSKSSRRESPNLKAKMQKAATLKSKLIETKKYSWFAPVITPCSTPFAFPDVELLRSTLEDFNNPPASEVEKVEATPADPATDRAR